MFTVTEISPLAVAQKTSHYVAIRIMTPLLGGNPEGSYVIPIFLSFISYLGVTPKSSYIIPYMSSFISYLVSTLKSTYTNPLYYLSFFNQTG